MYDPDRGPKNRSRNTAFRNYYKSVSWIRIRTDSLKEIPPGSGSAQTDADPDLGGNKVWK